MDFIDNFMNKWNAFCAKAKPTFQKIGQIASVAFDKIVFAWNYVSKFRKLFLAVPVGVMAVILALRNMILLPVVVGLGLQGDGGYSVQIIREVAVLGPMAITAICLLLMFSSRRTLTPWLVSVFSLALPLLILLTNTFPT